MLLLVIVATYFIKGRESSISYLAFGDVFFNYVQAFYYFFETAILIVVVGGLYGVLNITPGYKKLVKTVSDKVKEKKQLFVICMIVLFALLSSLTGLNLLLLIFIPFVVSIILVLGYDKLVALSSTFLAVMVGFIGGIFITFRDASNSYSTSYTTYDKLVGLDNNWDLIFPKMLLLFVGVGLLIFYVINHMKKIEASGKEIKSNDVFYVEAKSKGKVVNTDYGKVKSWPIVVMGLVLLVLLVLGYIPWSDLFDFSAFNDFHTWLTGLKVGNYEVFNNLISSSSITAFGTWNGSFMIAILLIALFLLILRPVSGVKFGDMMDGFIYGIKKMIPAVMIAMLGYTLLICVYNNGFFETIITDASKAFGDNVIIGSLIALVGSVLHVDVYYTVAGVFTPIVSSLSDSANLSVYAIMFQSLYGLAQIIGPTSLLLIVGLSYLEVPYKNWLKYIWRFVLGLIIVIVIILMIVSLL